MPKIIELELARTGLWGSTESATPLTLQDLQEVVETFTPDVPVTLGHQLADWMPAFGWVREVWIGINGDVLHGKVELSDTLADAYDNGLYRKWSIGIKRRPDGKMYLHHLAFLGSVPPKVKGLEAIIKASDVDDRWVNMADNELTIKSFAKTDWPIADPDTEWDAEKAKSRIMDKYGAETLAECCAAVILQDGEKYPQALSRYKFPFCDVVNGKVQIIPKAVSAGIAYLNGARGVEVDKKLAEVVRPVLDSLRALIEKKKQKEKKEKEMADLEKILEEKEKEIQRFHEMIREQKRKELFNAASGKLPKGQVPLLRALADSLPVTELEFSDENGETKRATAIDVLVEIFRAIPMPVEPFKTDGSSMSDAGDPQRKINVYELMKRI